MIPKELTSKQVNLVYAEEADVLNMALFGMTAKEWRENNKKLLEKNNLKVLVKFKKMCNNTNIIYKNNKKEEYIYTVFKEKRSQWL